MTQDRGGYGTSGMASALMPGDVRDYLLDHPDFLDSNDDLLAALVPPGRSRGDKVEDFQRFMLAKLQGHFQAIKGEHDDLLDLMQEHMQRQNRMHAATLALMDAPDFASMLAAASSDLTLQLEQVAVGLFMETSDGIDVGDYGGLTIVPIGFVDQWMEGREVILEERRRDAAALYGEDAAKVGSHALIRLSISNLLPPALLALGHEDPMYYATGLATDQVVFLGSVIERCFAKWLTIP